MKNARILDKEKQIMGIDWQKVLYETLGDLTSFVSKLIYIIIVLALARLILNILSRGTKNAMNRVEKMDDKMRAKEIITAMTLFRSACRYMIYFAAICLIINRLGFTSAFSNIVTAAGVGALVVSLGAQSIIGDIVAGAFIMFEHQYGVGDFVKLNEYEGTVTSLALRCTYLKRFSGEKIIVPNGSIKTVVNYSTDYNMASVDVPVAYEDDIDRITDILREITQTYADEHRDVCLGDPTVASINSFDDSSMKVTVMQKTLPRQYFGVQRDLRTLFKKRFDQEGISIPYPQMDVHTKS